MFFTLSCKHAPATLLTLSTAAAVPAPQLKMTVCIPFLWGVPPEVDALSDAIASAGGIVDRVYKQWGIYRPQFVRAEQQQQQNLAAHLHRRDSSKDIWC